MQLDCLPSDDRGRPHAAAHDMNIYAAAALLPVTGFPLLLGKSVSWFPDHQTAYYWFWLVGGGVGVVAYAVLALLVHPQEEKLAGSCQCTRALYRKDRDGVRRSRLQLLEVQAYSGSGSIGTSGDGGGIAAPLIPGLRHRARGWPAGGSDKKSAVGGSLPIGARLCDRLLFGSAAERVAGPGRGHSLQGMAAHALSDDSDSLSIAGVALD